MRMAGPMLARMARARVLGKSPLGAFLRLSEWCWNRLPRPVTAAPPFSSLAHVVHSLVRLQDRRMYLGTFFLRNRPELELIGRLANPNGTGRVVKLAVLGSSNGAEVYSIVWAVRSARPEIDLVVEAVDISAEAVKAGKEGVYERGFSKLVLEPIFARMTEREIDD